MRRAGEAKFSRVVRSEAETRRFAAALGRLARSGDVVGLSGPLGAGKTRFVQGLARGLGVRELRQVLSPTFALIAEHPGRTTLFHIDLYRLEREEDLLELGLRDAYYGGAGVCAVEWVDRFASARPDDYVDVRVEAPRRGGRAGTRRFVVVGVGARGRALAAAWSRAATRSPPLSASRARSRPPTRRSRTGRGTRRSRARRAGASRARR